MVNLKRVSNNPLITPNPKNTWESIGAFNGCVVIVDGVYHMVYRALSDTQKHADVEMQVSTIGYASSADGINFTNRRLLIEPIEEWEKYGCEDPRITYIDGRFYIFYTALSLFPFRAEGIRNAVAITSDFKSFEKHSVTTFNSKAMALFPEKINGKLAALLTINTDMPPAKIALAEFDQEEDMWSPIFWQAWHENANLHLIHLLRDMRDQVELGAPPIKTADGWLVIISYIKNYLSDNKIFGIEAVLLDIDNPRKVIGRTDHPLLIPTEKYELDGIVPNVTFPSGALVNENELYVYYGAADTSTCLAKCDLEHLLFDLKPTREIEKKLINENGDKFQRFNGNPIIKPAPELEWQNLATYNPAAIYENERVHILYRAQSTNGTSVIGYASSSDGLHIDENLDEPIYVPREDFEKKPDNNGNSGCEDPRITKIGDRFYMTYTAYDGHNPPRVAMTSVAISDFLNKNWNWDRARLITPPGVDDKDACVLKHPRKSGFLAFHRIGDVIWLDHLRDLKFPKEKFLTGGVIAQARGGKWDNIKLGIASPPIVTDQGLLLLYHAVSDPGFAYKVGAMLLDLDDPKIILARSDEPLFEPEELYETEGQVPNVVFPCGSVVIEGVVYIYYGGADSVVGVATMSLEKLLGTLNFKK